MTAPKHRCEFLPPRGIVTHAKALEEPRGPNVRAAEEIAEKALCAKLKGLLPPGLFHASMKELAVHVVACLDEVELITPDDHVDGCMCGACVATCR